MEARIIQKKRLLQLIDELVKENEVIAPRDELSFGKIDSSAQIRLDLPSTAKSLKEFFFPEREELLDYRLDREGITLTDRSPEIDTSRVIFAARPCDVASLPILDKLFAWDYEDAFYLERRKNTVIVSLACKQPAKTCFCTSVGGSPVGTEGADLLLTPLGNAYHVQVITKQGKELVDKHGGFFEESSKEQNQERKRLEDEWCRTMTKELDTKGLQETLTFDNPVWDTITQQCVDCGVCTFLCPTCHCFDIQDEGYPRAGCRLRLWDSCAFKDFTRMPHGQPRPTHYRRYRQRLMHKFRYYPENFGEVLCVGCGRCIQHCPVGVDITKELSKVRGK